MAMEKGDARQVVRNNRLARWTAPAVQRLKAGDAENACCSSGDNIINFS